MRSICLFFQVHQPFRYRRYRFFEIGSNHYYYDDYSNESLMRKAANQSYLPANKLMLELIKEFGKKFKITFLLSGTAIDQFELYAPDVLESFQKLAKTGNVEFLAEPYSHSLASLSNKSVFEKQVQQHVLRLKELFGVKPEIFSNSELIYNNDIGEWVTELGFKAIVTEGAKHILGWKSPNYIYFNAINPRLKLMLKNSQLSEDIAYRFSNKSWNEYPLTADKFVSWLKRGESNEHSINLFMNYETIGNIHSKDTGIFEFMKALPSIALNHGEFEFSLPSEIIAKQQPIAPLFIPHPISWAEEAKDVSAWLGNELQHEAFNKLNKLQAQVETSNDDKIQIDWNYLHTSDHLYHMSTKFFKHPNSLSLHNPYSTPYDAFINYMNILSDFELRLNQVAISTNGNSEIKVKKATVKKTVKSVSREEEVAVSKTKNVEKKAKLTAKVSNPPKSKSVTKKKVSTRSKNVDL